MCFFKYPARENDLPQDSHLWSLLISWSVPMCFFSFPLSENALPQDSHLLSLRSSWTVLLCFFRFPAVEKDLPQDSHLGFFWPLWTDVTFGLPHLYIQNSNGNVNHIYLWSTDMKCCWQQTAKEVWVVSTNFGLCIMTEIRFQNQQTTCNCEFK